MRAEPLIAADEWSPPGGRRFSFFTTNAELHELLQLGLPADLAPWHLTGSDFEERPGPPIQWVEHPWVRDEVDLAACATAPQGLPRANIFIWSEQLTTEPPPREPGSQYEALCCANGFLLVQPSRWRKDRGYSDVSISVVDWVVNIKTREQRHYPEYLDAFRHLRGVIRERLVAPSIRVDGSGNEHESRSAEWTRAGLSAYASGTVFESRPSLAGEAVPIKGEFGRQDRMN